MQSEEKQLYFESYNKKIHRMGRFFLATTVLLLLMLPILMGMYYNVSPNWKNVMAGLATVLPIYLPVAIVEFLIYVPMLGTGGSYLAFITGNLTNLKIPCALNARDIAKTETGTPENEIVSTLSIATSALVTTVVICIGVMLLVPLSPVLQNPMLVPAFDNVVAALFGALGLKYILKGVKIAVLPLLLMSILCITVPAAIEQTSLLLIPTGGLAIVIAYILNKRDCL